MDQVRCPFCVEENAFKPMTSDADGRFACDRCGHVTRPEDSTFVCSCPKCRELNRPRRDEMSAELRNYRRRFFAS